MTKPKKMSVTLPTPNPILYLTTQLSSSSNSYSICSSSSIMEMPLVQKTKLDSLKERSKKIAYKFLRIVIPNHFQFSPDALI